MRNLFIILFTCISFTLYGQVSNEEKIKQIKKEIESYHVKIENLQDSVDSIKVVINKQKLDSIKEKGGVVCNLSSSMSAKLRDKPDLLGKEIFIVPSSSEIQIIEYIKDTEYFKVLYKEKVGYVNEVYLSKNCNVEVLKSDIIINDVDKKNSIKKPVNTSTSNTLPKKSTTQYYRGSRGGCYYYNSSGNKQYVDRSYCN